MVRSLQGVAGYFHTLVLYNNSRNLGKTWAAVKERLVTNTAERVSTSQKANGLIRPSLLYCNVMPLACQGNGGHCLGRQVGTSD
jgi:hypothetical protein